MRTKFRLRQYLTNAKSHYLFVFIFVLSILSCNTAGHNNILENPYKKLENYNGSISSNIKDRIISPNQFVLNYINQMDATDIYSGYTLTETEKDVFMGYYNLLPEIYKNIIKDKVYAIYFINNFKGAGMTDEIFDNNNNAYTILYFNREILNETISKWVEYRDNSAFSDNENIDIKVNFNTDYSALLFGLLHETGHVYDFYQNVTPYLHPFLMNIQKIEYSKRFTQDVWEYFKKPKKTYNIFSTYEISFYDLGIRLDKELSLEFYTNLIISPFSSLYGSTSWAEDFAETYTYYFLYKYLGIRCEINIYRNNELFLTYCPNDNPLVIERYRFFEENMQAK